MKTISIFLALINSMLAGLLIACLISSADFQISSSWWSLLRILIALSVIAIGMLTWVDSIAQLHPGLIALGSLSLVAIGVGTIVWTFHRAQENGDMEYYMILYGGSLLVQGISLLFGISQEPRKISAT